MKPLLIVKAGTTFATTRRALGDFDVWTMRGLGLPAEDILIADPVHGMLPHPDEIAGVTITGSHSMVTGREPWSERLAAWTAEIVRAGVPLFGVCFGHQVLAHALGGQVGYHPRGVEIGAVEVELTGEGERDALFSDCPRRFRAHVTHYQTILTPPPGAVTLAANAHEPHHAIRVGEHAWGVQFHPEYDSAVMRSYIDEQRTALAERKIDADRAWTEVCETPEANILLRRFARYVETRRGRRDT
ncbi:MAG: glutamine amidotransferase [bacterium]|nr:glutamine amidotransferase [bacterium]